MVGISTLGTHGDGARVPARFAAPSIKTFSAAASGLYSSTVIKPQVCTGVWASFKIGSAVRDSRWGRSDKVGQGLVLVTQGRAMCDVPRFCRVFVLRLHFRCLCCRTPSRTSPLN